jgi:predicted transcriptional regulator of viral defense system
MNRLVSIVDKLTVVRAKEMLKYGIHRQTLKSAVDRGLLAKIDRGLYTRRELSPDFERQVLLACERVPHGVVCLESALRFHGILPRGTGPICMAIDSKARKPVVNSLRLRFVRFSGNALTQGVVNTRIDGVPVRIYSVAKTIADCLKYRRKIGRSLAARILRESIAGKKCSEQRLRHFAKICRVGKLVHAAYSTADNACVA